MGYYPIFIDMTGRRCLVIGGGAVGERKVESLLNVGAEVTVISPSLTERLRFWAEEGRVQHVPRKYRSGDLRRYQLAFVATENRELNETVAREGRRQGVWVNVADEPANCDFILPSVLRRGELVVAVATGGASPALSRAIREELEAYFSEDYALLAEVVAEVRRELRQSYRMPDPESWHRALDPTLRGLISKGKRDEARDHLLKRLGAGLCA